MHPSFATHDPPPIIIPAQAEEDKKPLSRLREREGAHPEGMGRVRECQMSAPSLTLPRPYGRGPLPLPQAGEGLIALVASARISVCRSAFAGVTRRPDKSFRVCL